MHRWFASQWRIARWPLFGTLAAAAFLLGYIGFRIYFEGQAVSKSAADLAYLSLQLFVLESGSVPEMGAPWQLEVARLLAPATTALALAAALAAVFREQLEELRLRRLRHHVVVCGLGARGAKAVEKLDDDGYQVVAVERDPTNPAIRPLRRRGVPVVVGDARNDEVLGRARVKRASHVVALTSTDNANAEVAIRAGRLASARRGLTLTCLAHIQDPDLCALLCAEELAAGGRAAFRIDFSNIYDQGARTLLQAHPVSQTASGLAAHVLVIGLSPLGQSLVAEAARQWRARPKTPGRVLQLTVVDPDADHLVRRLCRQYPQLSDAARLTPLAASLNPLDNSRLQDAIDTAVSVIYVCIEDDSIALQAALEVRHCFTRIHPPVVVQLTDAPGLAELLKRPGNSQDIRPFDLLDSTLRPDLLLGGTHEVLARAIHEEYLAGRRRQGTAAGADASLAPWEELPESLRESNRDQAAHIGAKLAAIGCGIAPLTEWDADKLTFSDEEVELLAEMEHERWAKQRLGGGWKPGPKDVEARTTPYLVPWDQLSQDAREWDRRAVRGMPAFLARAGCQVVRGSDAPPVRAGASTDQNT